MKDQVIKELTEMAKAGICRTDHVVEKIEDGYFDHVFTNDAFYMRVSEVADMILELA